MEDFLINGKLVYYTVKEVHYQKNDFGNTIGVFRLHNPKGKSDLFIIRIINIMDVISEEYEIYEPMARNRYPWAFKEESHV